jgi:vacuolar-type H+-ATPase subunit E/Vma4
MTTAAIRTKLTDYIRIADEKKLKAIYTMVEDEINEAAPVNYTPSLKSEMDRRVDHYLDGGKMISPSEMNKRLQGIRKKRK